MTNLKIWITAFLMPVLLGNSVLPTPHEYYISIFQINYNPDNQQLEIALKVFTDDLERGVSEFTEADFKLGDTPEKKDEKAVFRYIKSRILLISDSTPLSPDWVGMEIDLDVTWCYLQIPLKHPPGRIELNNRFLTEIYDAQQNIVHWQFPGKAVKTTFHNRANPVQVTGVN